MNDDSGSDDWMARRSVGVARGLKLLLLAAFALIVLASAEASAQWAETYGMAPAGSPFGGGYTPYNGNYWYGQQPPPKAVVPVYRASHSPGRTDPSQTRRSVMAPAQSAVDVPPSQPATTFCVRLCDGRFFPLSAADANVTPVKMCSALCPASRTKVFAGSSIDDATTEDGAPYAKLGTAFLFRKELVASCTCNGKNAYGLAKIDIAADPTLRAGDIVATAKGLTVFDGSGGTRHKAANFTPLRKSRLISSDLRRMLRNTKVAKN